MVARKIARSFEPVVRRVLSVRAVAA